MEGGKVPGVKEQQFYKDDYKNLYNSNKKLHRPDMGYTIKQTPNVFKKNKQREWTQSDQLFEDALWAS